METERAALVQRVLDHYASLERLPDPWLEAPSGEARRWLAPLSAADLRAVVTSLTILRDAARCLDPPADGQAGR